MEAINVLGVPAEEKLPKCFLYTRAHARACIGQHNLRSTAMISASILQPYLCQSADLQLLPRLHSFIAVTDLFRSQFSAL